MPGASWWPWSSNPLEGLEPTAQFEAIRWGRKVRRTVGVDVPGLARAQELVTLGYLRALVLDALEGDRLIFPRPFPWLAVGVADNRLYLVPRSDKGARLEVPGAALRRPIAQVWYDSAKGSERALYHHEFEGEWPHLARVKRGVQFRGGSYVVAPEGITG